MQYRSVNEIAKKWNVSERSVRNYCAHGRVDGAFLTGKTWNIPENAEKPERSNKKKEQPIDLQKVPEEEKLKYEIAEELGLLDKVLETGWKSLSAKETGRIGGLMTKRRREEKKN